MSRPVPRSLITQVAVLANEREPGVVPAMRQLLDRSQWLAPEELLSHQLEHLQHVLRHAQRHVPFYRERLRGVTELGSGELTLDRLRELPILTRGEVRGGGDELVSVKLGPAHRPLAWATTSGSTGVPIRSARTHATSAVATAIRERFHRWHGRDPDLPAAFITAVLNPGEADPPNGKVARCWHPGGRGSAYKLTIAAPVTDQLAWLVRHQPAYLATFPSNLTALLRLSEERGESIPALREVTLSSEPVSPELRQACARIWGAKVVATYSANEVGAIALPIPASDQYLVQSENVLVEVVDEVGRPCGPGEVGRVLVTTLHDGHRPLVRYEVGDHAEPGQPSPCGRGLPVLRRVLGRTRNMLRLPDGGQAWPFFQLTPLMEIPKLERWQLVQRTPGAIEVRLVAREPLTSGEEQVVDAVVREFLPGDFAVRLYYVDRIPRAASGKFEEFISEL